jgi:cytochrome c-type biogenesis protein CcmH
MTAFWLIAAAMLVGALAVLGSVLLRSRSLDEPDRDQQNLRIARERLAELQIEQQEGRLSNEDFEQAKLELESGLLGDLSGERPAGPVASAKPGRFTAGTLVMILPIAAIGLYLTLGAPQYLGPGGATANLANPHSTGANGQTLPPIEELVGKLEQKLAENPEDPNGWYLLGRTYASLGRHAEAAKSFERTYALVGDNTQVMLSLADSLAMAGNRSFAGRPAELIAKALKQSPSDPTALWLSAMVAQETGDYGQALAHFERLYPQLASDPGSQEEVRGMMGALQRKLGRPVELPAPVKQIAPMAGMASAAGSAGAPAGGPGAADAGRSVTVNVALSEALTAKASPGDTVFVFARAAEGPPMPLAVARKRVADLPVTVTLDDSMAMTPQMRLSSFPEVRLAARVSKTGRPTASSGDLQSDPVVIGPEQAGPVELVISQIVP